MRTFIVTRLQFFNFFANPRQHLRHGLTTRLRLKSFRSTSEDSFKRAPLWTRVGRFSALLHLPFHGSLRTVFRFANSLCRLHLDPFPVNPRCVALLVRSAGVIRIIFRSGNVTASFLRRFRAGNTILKAGRVLLTQIVADVRAYALLRTNARSRLLGTGALRRRLIGTFIVGPFRTRA